MNAAERRPPIDRPASMDARIWRSKTLSQNFLRDNRLIGSLVARSGITKDDTVLDIGAGKGLITRELAKRCRTVLAVEKDTVLVAHLQAALRGFTNVEIIAADILDLKLPVHPYKVFASIPYGSTATIIKKLTNSPTPPIAAHIVVQAEAASKFIGDPRMTLSALFLKPWFRIVVAHHFDRRDFCPMPSIDSVLLRIDKRQNPLLTPAARMPYRDFVVYCFGNACQSLYPLLEQLIGAPAMHALSSTFRLSRSVTPSEIEFGLWLCLFRAFTEHGSRFARRLVAGSELRLKNQHARLCPQR